MRYAVSFIKHRNSSAFFVKIKQKRFEGVGGKTQITERKVGCPVPREPLLLELLQQKRALTSASNTNQTNKSQFPLNLAA